MLLEFGCIIIRLLQCTVKTYCCEFGKELDNASRFCVSIAVSEVTRRHSSAHPFTPRLTFKRRVMMKTDRPRTRGLVFLLLPENFTFGPPFKI